MGPPGVSTELLVPARQWRGPVAQRTLCAVAGTPVGDIRLFRQKSDATTFEARAEAWETWDFVQAVSGEVLLTLTDAAAPGLALHAGMRRGVHGTLNGRELRAHAVKALRPGRRCVRLTHGPDQIEFALRHRRPVVSLTSAAGVTEVAAERHRGQWDIRNPCLEVAAAIAYFELGDLDVFLESPVLNNL